MLLVDFLRCVENFPTRALQQLKRMGLPTKAKPNGNETKNQSACLPLLDNNIFYHKLQGICLLAPNKISSIEGGPSFHQQNKNENINICMPLPLPPIYFKVQGFHDDAHIRTNKTEDSPRGGLALRAHHTTPGYRKNIRVPPPTPK